MRAESEILARLPIAEAGLAKLSAKPKSREFAVQQAVVDTLRWCLGPAAATTPEQEPGAPPPPPSLVIEWPAGEGAGFNIAELRYYLAGDKADLEDVLREFNRQCGYNATIIDLCGLTQPVSHPNKFHVIGMGDVDLGYPTGAVGTTQVSVYWSENWRQQVPYRTTVHAGHTLILWKLLVEKWPKCVIEAHSKIIEAVKRIGRVPNSVVVSDGFNHDKHMHVRPSKS